MMDKNDIAALELALTQSLAEPGRAEQVQLMLQEQDRLRVAEFCAYHRQFDTLRLQLWEFPPCWMGDDPDEVLGSDEDYQNGEREAAILLLRMQEFGVSRYHPDPLAAIEAACDKIRKRKRKRRRAH